MKKYFIWLKSSFRRYLFFWIVLCFGIFVVIFGSQNWIKINQLQETLSVNSDAGKSVSVNIFNNEENIDNPLDFNTIEQPVFPDFVCNIVDFGAKEGGVEKNTLAFEKAIASCTRRGGGSVIVPAGKWLTGPIHFKNNINLHLDKDAEILFSTDLNDYLPVVLSRFEGVDYYNYSPPLYALNCRNIAITGEGTLNGMSQDSWWKLQNPISPQNIESARNNITPLNKRIFGTEETGMKPPFIQFVNCKNILLEGFTLINSPMWAIDPVYSSDIIVRNVTVNIEGGGHNNDGIDIDSSRNVLIENSFFNTGDDAIVIKSGSGKDGMQVNKPSENIVIRNTRVLNGHAGVAIGSEISGGVRNVFVYNNNFEKSQYGFRIKTTLVDGGFVENIWVRNIKMKDIIFNAIEIANDYREDTTNEEHFPPTIKNINVENINCNQARGALSLRGSTEVNPTSLSFKNLNISSKDAINLSNASDIELSDITIDSKHESNITNIKGIAITRYNCSKISPECIRINGIENEDVDFKQSTIPSKKILFVK